MLTLPMPTSRSRVPAIVKTDYSSLHGLNLSRAFRTNRRSFTSTALFEDFPNRRKFGATFGEDLLKEAQEIHKAALERHVKRQEEKCSKEEKGARGRKDEAERRAKAQEPRKIIQERQLAIAQAKARTQTQQPSNHSTHSHRAEVIARSSQKASSQRNSIGWTCPSCSYFASFRYSSCSRCGVARPEETLDVSELFAHPRRLARSAQLPSLRELTPVPNYTSPQTLRVSTAHVSLSTRAQGSHGSSVQCTNQEHVGIAADASSDFIAANGAAARDEQTTRPAKLFGPIRVDDGAELPEVGQPEQEQAFGNAQDFSIKLPRKPVYQTIEEELAALDVADPTTAQAIAEQRDRQRDLRRRKDKRGHANPEDEYLNLTGSSAFKSDARRKSRMDREWDEKKRKHEKRQKEERKRSKEAEERNAMQETGGGGFAPVYLPSFISVGNLANALGLKPSEFVKQLEEFGFEDVSYSHVLDAETAGLIATEYGFEPRASTVEHDIADLVPAEKPGDASHLPTRPPVITIMGHVDHGKTTLLDWLRKSSVVSTEHGGITQHIGAFSLTMPSGKVITFLDTPGHEAFLDMRRRGAEVTDIVILVVAADDSVKPQTIEAIKHARDAGVPMIVAINKIDKSDVDPDAVKTDLARYGVIVEDKAGDVPSVEVSGKTGQGMVELEEAVVTLSEMLDHRADCSGNVEGWLIEATTKKGGKSATMLVSRGILRPGNIIVAGKAWARVRSLKNESGQFVKKALPGFPVEVDGWRENPKAGAQVLQAESEQKAKEVVELRSLQDQSKELSGDVSAINKSRKADVERRKSKANANTAERGETGELPDTEAQDKSGPKGVPFIVKADVSGSVEALVNSISSIGNTEVYARILRSGVGAVTSSDVAHAAAAGACIISFNMFVDPNMKRKAQAEGVHILDYNVIYEAMDEVKQNLNDHLPPSIIHRVTGEAEIAEVFIITVKAKGGKSKVAVAGCKVRNGVVGRGSKVKVLRGKEVVYTGTINSLKNVRKEVEVMRRGSECGICFDGFVDFKQGDQVQTFEEMIERRSL
ncbi:hypothetical protein KEM55_005532 [Ascosphaera atra]|nr:hypothetical protein KEM55_005532 [Ascosphaera atra]